MRARAATPWRCTSSPNTSARPPDGRSRPMTIFIVVDLPAPLGPRNPKIESVGTARSTLCSTWVRPKCLWRSWISSAGCPSQLPPREPPQRHADERHAPDGDDHRPEHRRRVVAIDSSNESNAQAGVSSTISSGPTRPRRRADRSERPTRSGRSPPATARRSRAGSSPPRPTTGPPRSAARVPR